MSEKSPGGDEMKEQLQALAGFLPLFEESGLQFGTWHGGEQVKPGVYTFPHFNLDETADSFVDMAYDQGWVLLGWDWPAWMQTDEAVSLRDDPEALASASPEQLAKLLTVLIRQDRFAEGTLDVAFESGLLTAIVRRAAALAGNEK